MERPKVAIFQANWPLQVHTTNPAKELISHGYDVDIFLYNVSQHYENITDIEGNSNGHLRIFDFSKSANSNKIGEDNNDANILKRKLHHFQWFIITIRYIRKILFKLIRLLRAIYQTQEFPPLPNSVIIKSSNCMKGNNYKCMIGIESYGLVWAGKMKEIFDFPLLYWSLELYTSDYPHIKKTRGFKMLKKLERKYHQQSDATIIQDHERAEVLMRDNGLERTNLLYVPVSLLGQASFNKSNYLYTRLNIPKEKKVILYFGMFSRHRYTPELVEISQDFPDDWKLVLHGVCYEKDLMEELSNLNINNRAIFSTKTVPTSEVNDLIASATIGLVFYQNDSMNDYLTSKASEKISLYSRAGVPMVTFNYPSYEKLINDYKCGRCVSRLSEVKEEIRCILLDYKKYQEGCLKAYNEVYEFSKQFTKVINFISNI